MFFYFSHCLSVAGLRPSSLMSTDRVVPLRGRSNYFLPHLLKKGWQSGISQGKIPWNTPPPHCWELNPHHGEDRQWDASILPLSYHYKNYIVCWTNQTLDSASVTCILTEWKLPKIWSTRFTWIASLSQWVVFRMMHSLPCRLGTLWVSILISCRHVRLFYIVCWNQQIPRTATLHWGSSQGLILNSGETQHWFISDDVGVATMPKVSWNGLVITLQLSNCSSNRMTDWLTKWLADWLTYREVERYDPETRFAVRGSELFLCPSSPWGCGPELSPGLLVRRTPYTKISEKNRIQIKYHLLVSTKHDCSRFCAGGNASVTTTVAGLGLCCNGKWEFTIHTQTVKPINRSMLWTVYQAVFIHNNDGQRDNYN